MRILEIADASAPLAEYANAAGQETLIVTRKGKPIAAVVGLADVDWESLSLSSNPEFQAIVQRSRESLRREGGISPADMRRRLGI